MSTKKSFVKTRKNLICGLIAMSMLGASASMLMTGCGNSIDLTNHLDYHIFANNLYDGEIEMQVKVDYDDIEEKYASTEETYDNHFYLDEVVNYSYLVATKEGEETELDSAEDSGGNENLSNSVYVDNLSKDDTVVITVSWKRGESLIKSAEELEEKSGLRFDTSDKTIKIKVADVLEEQALEVKEATESVDDDTEDADAEIENTDDDTEDTDTETEDLFFRIPITSADIAKEHLIEIRNEFIEEMADNTYCWTNTSIESVHFGENKTDGSGMIVIVFEGNHVNNRNVTKYGYWEMKDVVASYKGLEYTGGPSVLPFVTAETITSACSIFDNEDYIITKIS